MVWGTFLPLLESDIRPTFCKDAYFNDSTQSGATLVKHLYLPYPTWVLTFLTQKPSYIDTCLNLFSQLTPRIRKLTWVVPPTSLSPEHTSRTLSYVGTPTQPSSHTHIRDPLPHGSPPPLSSDTCSVSSCFLSCIW